MICMSAPYTLVIADRAGVSHTQTYTTLEAIAIDYNALRNTSLDVYIHGDSYDVDCDGEGYHVCDNGLDEKEEDWCDEHDIQYA